MVWRVYDVAWRSCRKRFLQLRERKNEAHQFCTVEPRRKVAENRMSNELTYMDCWNFVAPLIPVSEDYTMDIYVMVFGALKEAEKRRIAEKKKGRKATHEKAD